MKENLKDILSNLQPGVDQELLLKYLEGKLSAEQANELERQTVDEGFDADALEGLSTMQNKAAIAAVVEGLNSDLKKRITKKEKQPHRRKVRLEPWLLITIVFILLLAIIAYFIIHRLKGNP